jgi:hypothetical protein
LYDRAKFAPGEEATPQALEMQVEHHPRRTYFRQPCPFHSEGRCTHYAERWEVCRHFRCALLRRYQAGEIELAEARATIATAFALVAAVKDADPAAGVVGERRRLRRQLAERAQSGGGDRDSVSRRLINIIALDSFLERRFRNTKVRPTETPTPST